MIVSREVLTHHAIRPHRCELSVHPRLYGGHGIRIVAIILLSLMLAFLGAQRRRILGATKSQCSFIARRSDDEDGAVPPEPLGPMEVPGRGERNLA